MGAPKDQHVVEVAGFAEPVYVEHTDDRVNVRVGTYAGAALVSLDHDQAKVFAKALTAKPKTDDSK
jgi:hypothetical protein